MPISKLHSILANLLAHNNKSQFCYCGLISLQSAAANCSFSDTFGGIIYFAGDGASFSYPCLCKYLFCCLFVSKLMTGFISASLVCLISFIYLNFVSLSATNV